MDPSITPEDTERMSRTHIFLLGALGASMAFLWASMLSITFSDRAYREGAEAARGAILENLQNGGLKSEAGMVLDASVAAAAPKIPEAN